MINELVQRFKIYPEEDGKSVKTIESYVGDTSAFVAFLEEKGMDSNGEMKRFYITSYRNYLIEQQYELSTINKKVNSIHSFNQGLRMNIFLNHIPDMRFLKNSHCSYICGMIIFLVTTLKL